jgi:hypothetical protein
MQPVTTFVNGAKAIKVQHNLGRGTPPIVIFPHETRKPTRNNGYGPLP